jgi:hypothetical protein
MFKRLFGTLMVTTTTATEQQKLDQLRYDNAANQLMQLHCDRMQTAMDAR